MPTAQQIPTSSAARREQFQAEWRRVLSTFTPNMGDRYSGAPVSRARGIARKNIDKLWTTNV